jgi:ABC-type bacteriocin/lantibiotic exporter with double-glycine peptidase domain
VQLQSDKFSCGAFAIANALEAIGHCVDTRAVAELALTHPVRGTSERGVRRALDLLGYRTYPISAVGPGAATQAAIALRGALAIGHPVLLVVDRGEHWVAAVGILGRRFLVVDSSASALVRVVDSVDLTRWWRDRDARTRRQVYYGVALVP